MTTERKTIKADESSDARQKHASFDSSTLISEHHEISSSVQLPPEHQLRATRLLPESNAVMGLVCLHSTVWHPPADCKPYLIHWQLDSQKKTILAEYKDQGKPVTACAVFKEYVVIAYQEKIAVWDLKGELVLSIPLNCLEGHCVKHLGMLTTGELMFYVQGHPGRGGSIEVWNLKEKQKVHSDPQRLYRMNLGFTVLSNDRVVVSSHYEEAISSVDIFEWDGKKLNKINSMASFFLCETKNGILVAKYTHEEMAFKNLQGQIEIKLYDKNTLALMHSINYKATRLGLAFCLPNGNINLTSSHNFTKKDQVNDLLHCDEQSITLSPSLELIAAYRCFNEHHRAANTPPFEPIFFSNGSVIGRPLDYCDVSRLSEAKEIVIKGLLRMSMDLVRLVIGYTGDDLGGAKSAPRKSLHLFSKLLIENLGDEKQFPHECEFLLFFSHIRPTVPAKQALIKALTELLSREEEDTFQIEKEMASCINKFWQLLQSGSEPLYFSKLSTLLCEDQFFPPVDRSTWDASFVPEHKNEFSISKLRSLVAILMASNRILLRQEQSHDL